MILPRKTTLTVQMMPFNMLVMTCKGFLNRLNLPLLQGFLTIMDGLARFFESREFSPDGIVRPHPAVILTGIGPSFRLVRFVLGRDLVHWVLRVDGGHGRWIVR